MRRAMPTRPPRDTPTDEHRPPTEGVRTLGRPALLAAFPAQALVPLPPSGATVGRAWLADVGILDTEVSSSHMRLTRAGGRLQVEDAGSRNGTWLNGHKLPRGERLPLHDGGVLRVGRTLLVYREDHAGPASPAPPLGGLVGPWGLGPVRAALEGLSRRPVRNVLIGGESGAGKELLAGEVVRAIGRAGRPFAAVNVAGVAADVFEAQLFGWVRGAFSGSADGSPGLLKAHEGGTVFLDEIGELSPGLQPKLLRVLENQEVLPVGATRPVRVDVALVAATNVPLEEAVQEGRFRLDLLARFHARIGLPPLRERREDLFAIVAALWERSAGPLSPTRAQVEAVELLMLNDWPENVRGVARVVAAADPTEGLKQSMVERVLGARASALPAPPPTREAILATIATCKGNQSQAAVRLGLSRPQLLRLLKAMAKSGGTPNG